MVSADWLYANISKPNLIALDATWCMPGDPAPLVDTFIDGISMDIDVVADQAAGTPHMLPSPAEFETHMRELGLNSDSIIVCYDKHGLFSAPRAWWMLRVMGHDNIHVLDGGLPAWLEKSYPTVAKLRPRPTGDFKANFRPDLLRSRLDVRDSLNNCQILDARPSGRFDGTAPEPRAGLSSGHMPGASNIPFGILKSSSGFLKSRGELEEIFADVDLQSPIITTCGSGITACGIAISLARLGVWDAAVYDGSWAEWASIPESPIEKVET